MTEESHSHCAWPNKGRRRISRTGGKEKEEQEEKKKERKRECNVDLKLLISDLCFTSFYRSTSSQFIVKKINVFAMIYFLFDD